MTNLPPLQARSASLATRLAYSNQLQDLANGTATFREVVERVFTNEVTNIKDHEAISRTLERFEFVGSRQDGSGAGLIALYDRELQKTVIGIDGTDFSGGVLETALDLGANLVNNLVGFPLVGPGAAQANALISFAQDLRASGAVTADTVFVPAGHSLGGQTALFAKYAQPDLFGEVYVLNAPGTGGLVGSLANTILSALPGTASSDIYFISNTWDPVSAVGYKPGTAITLSNNPYARGTNVHSVESIDNYLRDREQLAPNTPLRADTPLGEAIFGADTLRNAILDLRATGQPIGAPDVQQRRELVSDGTTAVITDTTVRFDNGTSFTVQSRVNVDQYGQQVGNAALLYGTRDANGIVLQTIRESIPAPLNDLGVHSIQIDSAPGSGYADVAFTSGITADGTPYSYATYYDERSAGGVTTLTREFGGVSVTAEVRHNAVGQVVDSRITSIDGQALPTAQSQALAQNGISVGGIFSDAFRDIVTRNAIPNNPFELNDPSLGTERGIVENVTSADGQSYTFHYRGTDNSQQRVTLGGTSGNATVVREIEQNGVGLTFETEVIAGSVSTAELTDVSVNGDSLLDGPGTGGGYKPPEFGDVAGAVVSHLFASQVTRALGITDPLAALGPNIAIGTVGNILNQVTKAAVTPGKEIIDVFKGGNLGATAIGAASSAVAGFAVDQLSNAIGLHGFGDAAFDFGGALALTPLIDGTLKSLLLDGATFATTFKDLTQLYNVTNIGSAVGGFIGAYLGNTFFPAQTQAGSIGGALGGLVGGIGGAIGAGALASAGIIGATIGLAAPFTFGISALVGAFIGTVGGNFLGDLFGKKPKTPSAYTDLEFDGQHFYLGDTDRKNKGSRQISKGMAGSAAGVLNGILDGIGGLVINIEDLGEVEFGYKGKKYRAEVAGDRESFKTPAQAVEWYPRRTAVDGMRILDLLMIEGGDKYMKRALVNSTAPTIEGLMADLRVAQDYSRYLENKALINALIAANPNSAFALGWALTIARAAELRLDQPTASDWWNRLARNIHQYNLVPLDGAFSGRDLLANLGLDPATARPGVSILGTGRDATALFDDRKLNDAQFWRKLESGKPTADLQQGLLAANDNRNTRIGCAA